MSGLDDHLKKELIADLREEDISDQYLPIVELVGMDSFIKIADYVHGDRFYFPKLDNILTPARNRRIQQEYDGYNKDELAIKYDLTPTHIANIVRETIPGQMTFEDLEWKKDA